MFRISADVFAFRCRYFLVPLPMLLLLLSIFIIHRCCYCIHIEMILHCWIGLTMLHHPVYSLFSLRTLVVAYACTLCDGLGGFHSPKDGKNECVLHPSTCRMTFARHKFLMAYQTNTHDLSTIHVHVRFYAHFRSDKTFNITPNECERI